MRHLFLRSLLVTPVLFLIVLAQGAVSPALGACLDVPGPACGGIFGPCDCGDTVRVSTTLRASRDPVLRNLCPADGLFVASNVTLKISGTIKGTHGTDDSCSGIVVLPGATTVVVTTGIIIGFGTGVEAGSSDAFGHVTDSRITNLKISDCPLAGINLFGEDSDIDHVITTGCGGDGLGAIRVGGVDNRVKFNKTIGVEGGLKAEGIRVTGDRNLISRNLSERNGFPAGISIEGDENMVTLNGSNYNDNFGIEDSGKDNTFLRNQCTGNGNAPSKPPGLC